MSGANSFIVVSEYVSNSIFCSQQIKRPVTCCCLTTSTVSDTDTMSSTRIKIQCKRVHNWHLRLAPAARPPSSRYPSHVPIRFAIVWCECVIQTRCTPVTYCPSTWYLNPNSFCLNKIHPLAKEVNTFSVLQRSSSILRALFSFHYSVLFSCKSFICTKLRFVVSFNQHLFARTRASQPVSHTKFLFIYSIAYAPLALSLFVHTNRFVAIVIATTKISILFLHIAFDARKFNTINTKAVVVGKNSRQKCVVYLRCIAKSGVPREQMVIVVLFAFCFSVRSLLRANFNRLCFTVWVRSIAAQRYLQFYTNGKHNIIAHSSHFHRINGIGITWVCVCARITQILTRKKKKFKWKVNSEWK